MDKRLSFRIGFLTKLAEAGYTPDMLEKRADLPITPAGGAKALLGSMIPEAARWVGKNTLLGLALGLSVPPVAAGLVGGAGLAALNAPEDTEVEEDNLRDLKAHYDNLISKAKSMQRAHTGGAQGGQTLMRPRSV